MKFPKARTENIVEQNLGKETLIYDLITNKAFNLNETSTVVYKACNGQTTFEDLKKKHKFSDEFIYLALDELKRNNLLADQNYISPFAAANRREVIKKVGLASILMLPIITGLVAPGAASAASRVGTVTNCGQEFCNTSPELCSPGSCVNLYESCNVNDRPFCLKSICIGTVNQGNRCCKAEDGTRNNVYLPGEMYVKSSAEFPTVTFLSSPPRADGSTCAGLMKCCSFQQPYGTCNPTRHDGSLVDEQAMQEAEAMGIGYFDLNCTCTCPSI